jgi:hypothetical protein
MRPTFDGFTVVLLRQCVLTPKQLEHAMAVQRQRGIPFREALIQLGYATVQQVWRALAAYHGLTLVDLTGVVVPPAILNLVPESVAREIVCLPLAEAAGALTIALSEPDELADTLAKLRVLLNREIHLVLAVRAQLQEAIRTHYGSAPTESVNAMRTEPTDSRSESCEDGFPPAKLRIQECGRYLGMGIVEFKKGLKGLDDELVERRATIRYYDRMNPLRMFPLLVVLSKEAIAAVVQRHVGQNESQKFQVALDSVVEIEPILPGCQCYPPRELLTIRPQDVTAKFWVVPQVLGQIRHARIVVRQQGKQLAIVPLEIRVVRHGLTLLTGTLSLVVPFVVLLLKRFRLDFDSQVEDGFGLYAQLANWVLESVTPGGLAGLLLALTAILYFSLRPRKRDVFLGLATCSSGTSQPGHLAAGTVPGTFHACATAGRSGASLPARPVSASRSAIS